MLFRSDEDDEGEGEEGGAASGGTHKSRVYDMDGDDKLLNDDEVVQQPYFLQSIHPSITHPVLFSTIHPLYLSWSTCWMAYLIEFFHLSFILFYIIFQLNVMFFRTRMTRMETRDSDWIL